MNAALRLCLFLSLISLLVQTAHADEAKTLTPKAAFAKADTALNTAWAAAKAALSETEFNQLREDQRGWLQYRDYLARSPQFTGVASQEELPLDSPDYLEAAAGLTLERVEWLKAVALKTDDDTVTGVWSDSMGGRIQIVKGRGSLSFSISCVRGPTSHIGDMAGTAQWNQRIGWYTDKPASEDAETAASLAFILRDYRLEVIGANTLHYHGARAYFDGQYVKIAELNPAQQKEIVERAAGQPKN